MSDSVWPRRRQPTRLLCPCDSPGKNTGVGCHCLLPIICIGLLYSYFFCPHKPSWIKMYIWMLTMISVFLSVSPCMFYTLSLWAGGFHIWCIDGHNYYIVIVNDVLLYHKVSFLLLFNTFRIVFKGDLYSK